MIEAIDLFCGAGGLTAGLQKAGVKVKAGYDIEELCRYAFEYNNQVPFFNYDVSILRKEDIAQQYGNGTVRLLAGCAPCQPFSKYNQGKDTTLDKKWPLLYAFARLIEDDLPELVTMENVPEVVNHQVYHDFVQKLTDLGYFVWADTVVCADYGIPQSRRRHILLASRFGEIELMPPTHKNNWVVIKEVIGDLPEIKAGEQCASDPLHRAASLNALNLKRIKHSKPGGTWRDWPEELRLQCHKQKAGSTYGSVYGRMRWDRLSPTMTTQCYGYGNGRFGHPEQDRAISLREAAIFQTFPRDYQFYPSEKKIRLTDIGRMIGNAVPVRLGEVIGLSLIRHIECYSS